MNWVDAVIIVLMIAAIARGWHAGLIELALTFAGFLIGLVLGSWLISHIAPHFSSQLTKLLAVLLAMLFFAFVLTEAGRQIAHRLKPHAVRWKLGSVNNSAGSVLELVFTLIVIWLAASLLANVRSHNIGQSVNQSYIIRQLDAALPAPPDVFAKLEKIISPGGFPDVFLGLEPQHTTISPTNHVNNKAVVADEASVVKIQGAGCGGIAFGSGFVAAPDLVVTNAHVVAGISRPQVVDSAGSYFATPVWFDPNLDIAILKVNNLPDLPLKLNGQILPDKDAAATLGFPGGGSLVAENAAIIDHVTAIGRNIYNQGTVERNIYEVQSDVQEGDSGGPLLGPDGTVAGVVFAKSVSQGNIGYAILINQVQSLVSKAQNHGQVGTGTCTAD